MGLRKFSRKKNRKFKNLSKSKTQKKKYLRKSKTQKKKNKKNFKRGFSSSYSTLEWNNTY